MPAFQNRVNVLRASVRSAAVFLLIAVMLAASGFGQALTGRWAATGKTLDNGEQEKFILELKQSGSELAGTLKSLGFTAEEVVERLEARFVD